MPELIFNSNKELVAHLIDVGVLKTPRIIEAFLNVDRKHFVPDKLKNLAYADIALPIGYGQTISQPYTVAFMLELLQAQEGEGILDLGSGSAWTSALLAYLVGKNGFVYGKELINELVKYGQANIKKLNIKNVMISKANKNVLGEPRYAPYDRILVSAEAKNIPEDLLAQLKEGGSMIIPINKQLCLVNKLQNSIEKKCYQSFTFVPLVYKN